MSGVEFIVRGIVAIVLGFFLAVRFWRRWRQRVRGSWEWNGSMFDGSAVRPRLNTVRKDHGAALAPKLSHRKMQALVQGAREGLLRFPFFRTHSPDLHANDGEGH